MLMFCCLRLGLWVCSGFRLRLVLFVACLFFSLSAVDYVSAVLFGLCEVGAYISVAFLSACRLCDLIFWVFVYSGVLCFGVLCLSFCLLFFRVLLGFPCRERMFSFAFFL